MLQGISDNVETPGCHNWERNAHWHLEGEASDAAQPHRMYTAALYNKELPSPEANNAYEEEIWDKHMRMIYYYYYYYFY